MRLILFALVTVYGVLASVMSQAHMISPGFINSVRAKWAPANTWTAMNATGQLSGRAEPLWAWTGSKFFIWGGRTSGGFVSDGALYDPVANTWTALPSSGLAARGYGYAQWTGSKVIAWGGQAAGAFNNGALYDPATNTWTAMTATNAPAIRYEYPNANMGVWTGSKFIVWGGRSGSTLYNSGGMYDPDTNTWTTMSTTGAPVGRFAHAMVWTGEKVLVWGGANATTSFNTGGIFDPDTNTWSAMSTTNAPAARHVAMAVWTGTKLLIWGGRDNTSSLSTGGIYDPATDTWTAMNMTGSPAATNTGSSAWTGHRFIVWSGCINFDTNCPTSGGIFDPYKNTWTTMTATGAPSGGREYAASAWTGTEFLFWGGYNGTTWVNGGGRYR